MKFENDLEDIVDCSSNDVFLLAETPGVFFKAYLHVLEGLQEFGTSPLDLPLSRYLVDCDRRVMLLVSWCFEPSQPQRITLGLR